MTSDTFCSPCYESIWLQFFQKMSLIDSVDILMNSNGDLYFIKLNVKTIKKRKIYLTKT